MSIRSGRAFSLPTSAVQSDRRLTINPLATSGSSSLSSGVRAGEQDQPNDPARDGMILVPAWPGTSEPHRIRFAQSRAPCGVWSSLWDERLQGGIGQQRSRAAEVKPSAANQVRPQRGRRRGRWPCGARRPGVVKTLDWTLAAAWNANPWRHTGSLDDKRLVSRRSVRSPASYGDWSLRTYYDACEGWDVCATAASSTKRGTTSLANNSAEALQMCRVSPAHSPRKAQVQMVDTISASCFTPGGDRIGSAAMVAACRRPWLGIGRRLTRCRFDHRPIEPAGDAERSCCASPSFGARHRLAHQRFLVGVPPP